MAIYEFRHDLRVQPQTQMTGPGPGNVPTTQKQLSHAQGGRTRLHTGGQVIDPTDVEDFLMPGFHALDGAMKMYWSGMRVPTIDAYRFCRIKVAGGDPTLLTWRDDLMNGRVRLPVASLSQTKAEFNKDRFNPAYHPMVMRYPNKRGDRVILVYKPVPWLVEYTMSVWAEFKRDAEYIKYQVLTRFNPLAVFKMSDNHIQGDVTLRFGGYNDQSDKEATFDQHRMIKYDFSMTAEAWLPLPERLVPTVLGHVLSVKDPGGDVLLSARGHRGF